jgi:hypothetical protein
MSIARIFRWSAALALAAASPAALAAQEAGSAAAPVQVMIVGVYHFANPGLDVVKTETADVLSPEKQAEVARVVEALARFRPTKVAVEAGPERAPRLDSAYTAYVAGRHTPARNEVEQLGYRLARRFGHERVYPIDHGGDFPFERLMAYAQQHDTAFVRRVQEALAAIGEEMNRRQREMTVGEILRAENDPARIAAGHALYLEMAGVGAGDGYAGADLVSAWYARNIRIYANLRRIARPGDRIVVIFGAGHLSTLRELVRGTPGMTLVEARDYLPAR